MNPVAGAETTRRIGVPGAPSARLPLPRAANVNFVLFWAVAVLTLVKIGQLAFELTGGVGVARFITLIVLLLAATARSSPVRAAGVHGILFLLAVMLYHAIGIAVTMYNNPQFFLPWGMKYELFGLLLTTVVATGVHDVASRIGTNRLLAGILAILTLHSVAVMVVSISIQTVRWYSDLHLLPFRSTGGHEGPNQAAYISCVAVATACAMMIWHKRQGWIVASMVISVAAIVATASRTGLLFLAIIIVASNVYAYRIRGSILAVPTGIAAVVVFALVVWYVTSPDEQTFIRLMNFDFGNRLPLWSHALSMIQKAPLLGNGYGTLLAMQEYTETSCHLTGGICGAHNQHLVFLGEAGMLPFLLWVAFFVVVFKKCSWLPNSLPKAVAGSWMAGLALYSMVHHVILTSVAHSFFIGVACGLLTWDEATSGADLHRDKPLE